MMKLKNVLFALSMLVASAGASANLVTNGDFSAGGTGWTLSGNTGYASFPGYWNDGAVGSDAFLSQTIATIAGQLYEVSFDTSVNSGFSMAAALDGIVFATTFVSGHFDFNVVAANDNAVLTFITRNDPSYNQLDNVVVNAVNGVPEPGSLALLGLGAVGLAALRRKKAQAA